MGCWGRSPKVPDGRRFFASHRRTKNGAKAMNHANENLTPDLQRASEAVERLPKPQPPADLADRTLARIEAGLSRQDIADLPASEPRLVSASALGPRRSWLMRKITNPLARVAAVLLLVTMLGLVVNLDTGERIGRISENILGEKTTDRIERFLDHVFVALGPADVSERDVARLAGLKELPKNNPTPWPSRKPEHRPTTWIESAVREA